MSAACFDRARMSDDPMSCKCTSLRCSIRASKCEQDAVFEGMVSPGGIVLWLRLVIPGLISFLLVIRVRGFIDNYCNCI